MPTEYQILKSNVSKEGCINLIKFLKELPLETQKGTFINDIKGLSEFFAFPAFIEYACNVLPPGEAQFVEFWHEVYSFFHTWMVIKKNAPIETYTAFGDLLSFTPNAFLSTLEKHGLDTILCAPTTIQYFNTHLEIPDKQKLLERGIVKIKQNKISTKEIEALIATSELTENFVIEICNAVERKLDQRSGTPFATMKEAVNCLTTLINKLSDDSPLHASVIRNLSRLVPLSEPLLVFVVDKYKTHPNWENLVKALFLSKQNSASQNMKSLLLSTLSTDEQLEQLFKACQHNKSDAFLILSHKKQKLPAPANLLNEVDPELLACIDKYPSVTTDDQKLHCWSEFLRKLKEEKTYSKTFQQGLSHLLALNWFNQELRRERIEIYLFLNPTSAFNFMAYYHQYHSSLYDADKMSQRVDKLFNSNTLEAFIKSGLHLNIQAVFCLFDSPFFNPKLNPELDEERKALLEKRRILLINLIASQPEGLQALIKEPEAFARFLQYDPIWKHALELSKTDRDFFEACYKYIENKKELTDAESAFAYGLLWPLVASCPASLNEQNLSRIKNINFAIQKTLSKLSLSTAQKLEFSALLKTQEHLSTCEKYVALKIAEPQVSGNETPIVTFTTPKVQQAVQGLDSPIKVSANSIAPQFNKTQASGTQEYVVSSPEESSISSEPPIITDGSLKNRVKVYITTLREKIVKYPKSFNDVELWTHKINVLEAANGNNLADFHNARLMNPRYADGVFSHNTKDLVAAVGKKIPHFKLILSLEKHIAALDLKLKHYAKDPQAGLWKEKKSVLEASRLSLLNQTVSVDLAEKLNNTTSVYKSGWFSKTKHLVDDTMKELSVKKIQPKT